MAVKYNDACRIYFKMIVKLSSEDIMLRSWIEPYSYTCLKQPLKKDQKLVFKTNDRLMQVKSIA